MTRARGRSRLLAPGAAVAAILTVGCDRIAAPATQPEARAATVHQDPEHVPAQVAVEKADVAQIHPGWIDPAEASRLLEAGPGCSFRYAAWSKPQVVVRAAAQADAPATALVKINGRLVTLRSARPGGVDALARGAVLGAEGLELTLTPTLEEESRQDGARQWPADLELHLPGGFARGYRGIYRCDS